MIRRKIAAFMRGRYGSYGVDRLNFTLLVFSLAVMIVGAFVKNNTARTVLIAVQWASYVYFFFRLLSRNVYKRQKENAAFCAFFKKAKNFFKLQKDRIKDFKEYRYRKCPSCKAVLRLPARRGKHSVRCPKCSKRFDVRNIF